MLGRKRGVVSGEREPREVVERRADVRVVRPQRLLAQRQAALIERLGLGAAALALVQPGQVVLRSELGTAALRPEVAALLCGLDARAWDGKGAQRCGDLLKLPPGKAHKDGQPLPFDAARAHALYVELLGEARDLIKGKHLLIDGATGRSAAVCGPPRPTPRSVEVRLSVPPMGHNFSAPRGFEPAELPACRTHSPLNRVVRGLGIMGRVVVRK